MRTLTYMVRLGRERSDKKRRFPLSPIEEHINIREKKYNKK